MGLYRSRLLCTELFSDKLSQLLNYLIEKYSNYIILCAGYIYISMFWYDRRSGICGAICWLARIWNILKTFQKELPVTHQQP